MTLLQIEVLAAVIS